MNLPNKLTIFRIILSPIFMVFFLVDTLYTRYIALAIFLIASLTDLYDGYLARKTGVITSFGKFMDPLADKILTSTALICFASLGYIYTWMVLVIIGRDFIVTGLRCIAAYRGLLILPTQVAKWKTASQMVVIVIILLYINVQTTMIAYGQWNGSSTISPGGSSTAWSSSPWYSRSVPASTTWSKTVRYSPVC